MHSEQESGLSERQQREIEYHREHAQANAALADQPVDFEVVLSDVRRWWNPYWDLYSYLRGLDLSGESVLVVGCGFGEDALRIGKLGAKVSAFDLSSDSLAIARKRAEREGMAIDFRLAPAEKLPYEDSQFDVVVAHDVLHHCDVAPTVAEMRRVTRPGGLWVISEVYSHSMTEVVRRSHLVEDFLYTRMRRVIYGVRRPYITADERKMSQRDMAIVMAPLGPILHRTYYNFLVRRILPEIDIISKVDRIFMRIASPLGPLLGGRVLVAGVINKP